jgi:small subunit ribosomal protein S18
MDSIKPEKKCVFCAENVEDVDYKDIDTLRRFINYHQKILPRKRTGTCSKHQRKLSLAIKRARVIGLLAFVPK